MYNTQPQPTLPPITAAIGVGENYTSSLGNGDMLQHHIKQEQDFEQTPPSLPPIRTTIDHNNNNNHSIMSINQLCNDTESDYEKMKEAAAVLENMKTTSLPPIANISSQPQPQPLEPRTHAESSQLPNSPSAETGFMSRLANVYDYVVESGVSRFKPVIEHVYGPLANPLPNNEEKHGIEKDDALGQSENENRKRRVSRSSSPSYRNSRPHRTSQSSGSSNSSSYAPYTYPNSTVSATTTMRSRWQQMVLGAFGAAGAVVSEESMKSLKYCLQWINYATQHIDTQIAILREFIVNLTNSSHRAVVHTSSTSTLSSIKKEVVDTLRKVIEVVSKYAGACLPDPAKRKVRSFILTLPTRWASINHTEHSSSPSPISSPQLAPANGHPLNQTTDYARRLLSLATESLDMLRSVAGIFGETVGKAEAIVERLGIPSGGANAMGNLQFDNIWSSQTNESSNGYAAYSSSSTSSHSPSVSRSRRSSNSARVNHGTRKPSRPTPPLVLKDNDEEEFNDSESSSESEAEPMRMEMDNAQKRALKSANAKSQQQHANGVLNGIKKRKKIGKKDDRMDIS